MNEAAASSILARFSGENGVEIEVHDESTSYGYTNLFRVCLRVIARIPGSAQSHERVMERLGVSAGEVKPSQEELLERFRRNTLPYLLRPDFPSRFTDYRRRQVGSVIRFRAPS